MYKLFKFIQSNDFEKLFWEMGAVSRLFDHFYEVFRTLSVIYHKIVCYLLDCLSVSDSKERFLVDKQ